VYSTNNGKKLIDKMMLFKINHKCTENYDNDNSYN